MAVKNKPKRDGSGQGIGANKGRGGCVKPRGANTGNRRRDENAN